MVLDQLMFFVLLCSLVPGSEWVPLSQGRDIFLTVSYSFSDSSLRLPSDAH